MKRTLCALALLLVTASGSPAAAAILYAATGSNGVPGVLYTVDPVTGTFTPVGSTVITDPANCPVTAPCAIALTGLAFHPSTGVLYGFTANFAQGTTNLHSLVTIDPTTGVATLISTNAIADDPLGDIAFAADGTLYGWQAGATTSDSLVQINLTDGTQTQIGLSGLGGTKGNGLSFANGTLFLAANGTGASGLDTGELRTVDPATGNTTVVATLSGAPQVPGAIPALAVDASGTLFGVVTNSPTAPTTCHLVTINTANGVVTDHGLLPQDTDALAFATADLSITKSHTGNFFQGQTGATYSITVTNVGSAPSGGTVTVTEAVPSGLIATGIAGPGWGCTQPSGPCTRSDVLDVNQSYAALTLTVNVANNAPSPVTNSATVSGGGEVNAANDTANDVTTIAIGPDPAITKTHTGNFTQGQIGATYTITVSNAGATPTSGTVTVTDAVPSGLTATGIAGTGWACTPPSGPCTRADALAAGASYPALTLTVNVASNAPSSVTNSATVAGGGNVNTANDTANDVTGIVTGAATDLTITKTHVGNFAQGQTGATYTITVSNVGGAPTDGTTVTVTDALPTGLTATGIAGTGWVCTPPSGPCTTSDVLASLASYPALTLTVDVATDAPTLVTNSATVAGGGDASPGNDTATDPTTITHAGTQLFTVVPCRVLDTRNPNGPLGGPVFASEETRIFTVAGTCSIPAGAVSISVNLTVTNQQAGGFLNLYAGNATAPATSVLNFRPGKTRANNAIVALSSDGAGTIAIKNRSVGSADVILDVNGYFQ